MSGDAPDPAADAERLALVREETRFELGLLHDRVNALLGLLLALLSLPGVRAAVRIVLAQTALQAELVGRLPGLVDAGYHGVPGRPSMVNDQRRSLLFFRTVPVLFGTVWIVLGVLSLVLVS